MWSKFNKNKFFKAWISNKWKWESNIKRNKRTISRNRKENNNSNSNNFKIFKYVEFDVVYPDFPILKDGILVNEF